MNKKELSIKEKAKAYDEVREKIAIRFGSNVAEEIFSEYEESEDERIRKWLIELVEEVRKANPTNAEYNGMCGEAIAWLEKQGEQKLAVETKVIIPKFRIGDIVKSKSQPMLPPRKIIFIGKDCYWCEDGGCIGFAWEDDYEIVEQKSAEWSEEDASLCTKIQGILSVCRCHNLLSPDLYKKMYDWLKSLRPQNWTKEDNERYKSCLQRLSTGNPEQPETINSKWFKEHVYSQATWKPSEEQIKALSYYIENYVDNDGVFGLQLVKLYHDLLILRKE